jgi:hypothetical protein
VRRGITGEGEGIQREEIQQEKERRGASMVWLEKTAFLKPKKLSFSPSPVRPSPFSPLLM